MGEAPVQPTEFLVAPPFRLSGPGSTFRRRTRAEEAQINLRQLEYLVKIIELGNMTAAANELGMAQPALGSQIRLLEKEFQLTLLKRHSRGVVPTEGGELLARGARDILARVERLTRELETLSRSGNERLSLGVSPTLVFMIGDIIRPFAKEIMPNISLSLLEDRTPGLVEALDRHDVDMAFIFDPGERASLKMKAMLEEDLLLISSPSRAPAAKTITFEEALGYELVIAGSRGVIRNIAEREAQRLSLKLKVEWEVHSLHAMKATIDTGDASTILPYSIVSEDIAKGRFVCTRIDNPSLKRVLFLVQPMIRQPLKHEAELDRFFAGIITKFLERMGPWARRLRGEKAPD